MEFTAAVLREPTDTDDFAVDRPVSIERVELPAPTGEEVLVEIGAASLCHTDISIAHGYIEESYPMVMGHEGAGVVVDVGEDVTSVSAGDHVVLGRISCGSCQFCRTGKSQLCTVRADCRANGTLRTGAVRFSQSDEQIHHCHSISSFSELTMVTEEVAVPITDEIPLSQATLLGCGVFTGVGAVTNTVDVEPNASVVIFGAGGVGLSAVQAAAMRAAGQIIVVDLVPEKLALAEQLGATDTITAGEDVDVVDRIHDCTDGGADYAFEIVGHAAVTSQAIESVGPTGTAVLVGVPPVGTHSLDLSLFDVVVGEKTIQGSFNGSYNLPVAITEIADLVAAGHISLEELISDTWSLEDVNDTMAELETGTGIRHVLVP